MSSRPKANAASTTGTALGTIQGSCLPLISRISSFPVVKFMVFWGLPTGDARDLVVVDGGATDPEEVAVIAMPGGAAGHGHLPQRLDGHR